MCGISGIIGPQVSAAEIAAMVAVQHHRGPDDRGVDILAGGRVALGHNRLSILDLSKAGHQPMASPDGSLTLVFNGEIFNYLELKRELADYPFRSETDSEVVLAAYERWGAACVEKFVGQFAIALWDGRNNRLFCARDRLGVKPFHYARHGGRFLFASEIKALLAAGVPAEPDRESWGLYLTHGVFEQQGRTFFKDIESLAAGHVMTVSVDGEIKHRRYWDLAQNTEQLPIDDETAAGEVSALIEEAVRLRLRADVPVGVMLSGGLDSAAVMATADRLLPQGGAIETFTGIFGDPRYDEDDFSDKVPRQARWERNIARLDSSDVPGLAETALWHQEAPYGGISTLLYHPAHGAAKEKGITVLLEGQGGDELFAGYDYFRPAYYLDLLAEKGWRGLRREARSAGASGLDWIRRARQLRGGRSESVYYDGTRHLRDECVAGDLVDGLETPDFAEPFPDHLRNALYRDLCFTKLPRVLRMNDRVCMAHSLELRQPLIDHRLVEYAFRLSGRQKIRDGQGKFILRQAMARALPDTVRNAPKRFVVTPQREWLAGPLSDWVSDLIESQSFKERGLFNVSQVRRAWREFKGGENNNAVFVWQWINTELWFRRFIDKGMEIEAAGSDNMMASH